MTLTCAIRKIMRECPEARCSENQNIVYDKVCTALGKTEPCDKPNPGSVSRIWHRNKEYFPDQRRQN